MSDVAPPVAASDQTYEWSDAHLLGFTPMDEMHEEFYTVARKALTCTDATMHEALAEIERHLANHFQEEDRWMVSTEFPPRDCHMDEHNRVLTSVHEVREALNAREIDSSTIRYLGLAMLDWFPGHAHHMDSALAAWVCKQTMGGKPVVLRRRS